MIFDIQRFSTHDGAGIRTIVFLKGCSLSCPWCENPESQSFRHELAYDEGKCISCLECLRAARDGEIEVEKGRPVIRREKMGDLQKFADACPTGALTVIGEKKGTAEIVREVEKDLLFYRKSGGGVTISGGEPYDQPVFLLELLKALGEIGLTAAVETSLSVPWAAVEPSLSHVETFLADIKHADASRLKDVTGGDLPRIMGNLRRLEARGAAVTVRVPLIPGFNDSQAEVADIIDLAASLRNVHEIHFLPFHTLGMGKYRLLGREYGFLRESAPSRNMGRYLDLARSRGLEARPGG